MKRSIINSFMLNFFSTVFSKYVSSYHRIIIIADEIVASLHQKASGNRNGSQRRRPIHEGVSGKSN